MSKGPKKQKEKEKKAKSTSSKELPQANASSGHPTGADTPAQTNGSTPQASASPRSPRQEFMPDMAPLNKLELNRSVLSCLEQHSKEVPNQQAVVYVHFAVHVIETNVRIVKTGGAMTVARTHL